MENTQTQTTTTTTVEEQTNVSGTVEDSTQNYIDTIKNLKQNTVDKASYEKLKAENKQLLDSIVNGTSSEQTVVEAPQTIEDMRKDLFGSNEHTNLEYAEKALKLREALIERGEVDPFLPQGHKVTIDNSDIEAANRVAEIMQECVDYADGDSNLFTNELQRRMVDNNPFAALAQKAAKRKK